VHQGNIPERPMVILAQQTLFDPSRAPEGRHTAWAYCHVPHGSDEDITGRIEAQVERFAPGFGDRILERSVMCPADLEAYNPNNVGGDIAAGRMDLRRMLMRNAYVTPLRDVYICSSWMPPGPGVHGMSGYHAARAALRRR
jgi:phytoene dehydrogenase-like protein